MVWVSTPTQLPRGTLQIHVARGFEAKAGQGNGAALMIPTGDQCGGVIHIYSRCAHPSDHLPFGCPTLCISCFPDMGGMDGWMGFNM